MSFAASPLAIDGQAETQRIVEFIRTTVAQRLNRRGIVLGVSGGIDSAVCAALAARALGPERVLALLMPEPESSVDGHGRAIRLCEELGLPVVVEDIGGALEALGAYRRRDAAIRRVIPGYGIGWRHKIAISGSGQVSYFNLVAQSPHGVVTSTRMPIDTYLQVVAATNYKQRLRKAVEYHHADALNHAVLGTPNRLEYELGFFVRGGDGLADLKPIAHLYKTQVYALAEHLGIPEEIRRQPPSTDTYTLPQTQEEFYFALPYQQADLVLHAMDHGTDPTRAGALIGLDAARFEHAARDFAAKRRIAARGLREAFTVADA